MGVTRGVKYIALTKQRSRGTGQSAPRNRVLDSRGKGGTRGFRLRSAALEDPNYRGSAARTECRRARGITRASAASSRRRRRRRRRNRKSVPCPGYLSTPLPCQPRVYTRPGNPRVIMDHGRPGRPVRARVYSHHYRRHHHHHQSHLRSRTCAGVNV